jgi:hypothetical protein
MSTLSLTSKAISNLIKIMPPSEPILISGPTGIGKSDMVQKAANDLGMPLIDLRVALMEPGDLMGFPVVAKGNSDDPNDGGVTYFCKPGWLKTAMERPCVIFLDEANRGSQAINNAIMQLVLERRMSNGPDGHPYYVHPECRIVAAINEGAEYTVEEFDPAQYSRFFSVKYVPDIEAWSEWARENSIDDVIVEFCTLNPSHWRIDPSQVEGAFPTPRGWTKVNKALKANSLAPSDHAGKDVGIVFYHIVAGFVGQGTAGAFRDYVQSLDKMVDVKDIFFAKNEKALNATLKKVKSLSVTMQSNLIEQIVEHCPGWIDSGKLDPIAYAEINCKLLSNIEYEHARRLHTKVTVFLTNIRRKLANAPNSQEQLEKLNALRTKMSEIISDLADVGRGEG